MKTASQVDSESVSDLLDLTVALLNGAASDRKKTGPRTKALVAQQPALDLPLVDRLVDTLFAADPNSYGVQCAPFRVSLDAAAAQRIALDFRLLERQVVLLRTAAQAAVAGDPSQRWVHVLATMETYRDPSSLTPDDSTRYTALSIQDMGYQVDSFFDELPLVAGFSSLQVLVAFGNDIEALPFDCAGLPQLRSVDLSENALAVVPKTLYQCRALEYLDLSRNPIEQVPDGIGALSELRYLGLSGTALGPARVDAIRAALPQCLVDTDRRVYSDFEKTLNFVLNSPTWTIRGDRVVEPVSELGLPRGTGLHVVAARVDLSEGQDLPAAVRIDAASGAVREVWWRTAAGEWLNVSDRALDVRPAFSLAGG